MDYEAELVVVIGRRARAVAVERALEVVAGYCAGQDISDRKLQFSDKPPQFSLGKSLDGFGPIGPEVVSLDGLRDPNDLETTCEVAGERLHARTTDMIFAFPSLAAYLSRQYCTPRAPATRSSRGRPRASARCATPVAISSPAR